MEFRKISAPAEPGRIAQVSQKFSVTEPVAELLLMRGFTTDKAIDKFLNPSMNDLHDPMLLDHMPEAVEKIRKAMAANQKILIFGDYDVDGISASYILLDFLGKLGAQVDVFLPNRYVDGYGLTIEALDKEIARFSPDLIITVDCGISSFAEVEYIKSRNLDVIITDHHDCPEILPDCLVVNAKKTNQKYPFSEICGAGVAFKLVQAMAGKEAAMPYLPITAFATVADIMPLVDENRAIVKFGLDAPLSAFPLGLATLAKELKITGKMSSQDVGFKLAPKINAAGRMGNAQHSLDLYLAKDKSTINKLIVQLLNYNVERQEICSLVEADCIERIKKMNLANHKTIVLAGDNWNIGILGIVAARVAEEFNRPTILVGRDGNFYKGSCRSIAGMNIHNLLSQLGDILTAFGGHIMAAGLTLAVDKFPKFAQKIEELVQAQYPDEFFVPFAEYDLDVEVGDINTQYIQAFSKIEPFGNQNQYPVFRLKFGKNTCNPMKNNPQHVMISLPNLTLLAFNSPKLYNTISQSGEKECLTELQVDSFRGVRSCKGVIQNIQMSSSPNVGADRIGGEYIKQLALSAMGKRAVYTTYKKEGLDALLLSQSSFYGTLIIANTMQSYRNFMENSRYAKHIVCHEYLHLTSSNGFNTLCLCPAQDNALNNFNRIILLDSVLDESYIVSLNNATRAEIFLPQNSPFVFAPFGAIDLSRKVFGDYFNILKTASKQKLTAFDDFNFFNKLKKTHKHLNYVQFVACVATFSQIGVIQEHSELGNYHITINSGTTSKLELSTFYNKLELILKSY